MSSWDKEVKNIKRNKITQELTYEVSCHSIDRIDWEVNNDIKQKL